MLQPKLKRLQDLQTEIYRQLQLLIPDQVAHYDSFQSQVHGSPLLRMDILERHPYTHFVRLTYQFNTKDIPEIAPDAHIRVYNDARLAEATSFDPVQGFDRSARGRVRDTVRPPRSANRSGDGSRAHLLSPSSWLSPLHNLQRHWRQNAALDKWLSYLLHQGHSLSSMQPANEKIDGIPAVPVRQTTRST
ncbi:MAG: DUF1249 domain-containing protein [Lysobacterales bacterium]